MVEARCAWVVGEVRMYGEGEVRMNGGEVRMDDGREVRMNAHPTGPYTCRDPHRPAA